MMSINPPRRLAILSTSSPLPARTSVGVSAIFSNLMAFNAEEISARLSRGIETEIDPLSSDVATTAPNCIGALARGVSSMLTRAWSTTEGPRVGVAVGEGVTVGVDVRVLVCVGLGVLEEVNVGVLVGVALGLCVAVAVFV